MGPRSIKAPWLVVYIMRKCRITVLCNERRTVHGERKDLVLQGIVFFSTCRNWKEILILVLSSLARNPVKGKLRNGCY